MPGGNASLLVQKMKQYLEVLPGVQHFLLPQTHFKKPIKEAQMVMPVKLELTVQLNT